MSKKIDFNLLAVFEALFAERSVTRAALRHGITQSAMSNALRRLRAMFGDPLFVRTPYGIAPTAKAMEFAPTVEAALASLRAAVGVTEFDPRHSHARFTLGTLDYLEALYAPQTIADAQGAAPGVTVRIHRLETLFQLPADLLASGTVDCALGLFPKPLAPQSGLHDQVLGKEEWACVLRRNHPALARPLTLETYAELPHVAVNYPGTPSVGMIDLRLAEQGFSRNCAVWTPHFSIAPFYAAASDCIATVPRRLAVVQARALALEIVELPLAMPAILVTLVWSVRMDRDPAHRWFRTILAKSVQKPLGLEPPN